MTEYSRSTRGGDLKADNPSAFIKIRSIKHFLDIKPLRITAPSVDLRRETKPETPLSNPFVTQFRGEEAPFIRRALYRYRKKLVDAGAANEFSSIVGRDVAPILEKVSRCEEGLEGQFITTDGYLSSFGSGVLEDALKLYKEDIQEAMVDFRAGIGREMELPNLQREIEHASRLLDEISQAVNPRQSR